jgi:hypothetical protein
MRRFSLVHDGMVTAEGIQFTTGEVSVRWTDERSPFGIYASIDLLESGAARVVWIDDEYGMPYRVPKEIYRPQRMAPLAGPSVSMQQMSEHQTEHAQGMKERHEGSVHRHGDPDRTG